MNVSLAIIKTDLNRKRRFIENKKIDLLRNNFRDEISEFGAKTMKDEAAYLAKVSQRVLNDLQLKF